MWVRLWNFCGNHAHTNKKPQPYGVGVYPQLKGYGNFLSFNSHNHFKVTTFVSVEDTPVNTLKTIIPTECPKETEDNNRYEVQKNNKGLNEEEKNVFHVKII